MNVYNKIDLPMMHCHHKLPPIILAVFHMIVAVSQQSNLAVRILLFSHGVVIQLHFYY